ncbi:MAG: succinylglutamate desuccinylase/aspartoacylase family protein, partial [Anaerolineae bacterium]|nr:succinylglutamate desuccinylase/aspartoacylase family protein [Anaerolineae bacterium]
PTLTPLPTYTFAPLPSPTEPQVDITAPSFVFGQAVSGQTLIAHRYGTGENILMLIGGVHGGWETNTTELMNELIAHFGENPTELLADTALIIIPVLNPDGAARGRVLEGRFNDHQVDLNRNWSCDWEPTAYFQNMEVSAGSEPLSEPETQALADLILQVHPKVVLLYHSAADGIFAGDCNDDDAGSEAMAVILGEATGYSYGSDFTAYRVTGTAPGWIAAQGIASADVELATWRTTEFDRNLRGVQALLCWLSSTCVS